MGEISDALRRNKDARGDHDRSPARAAATRRLHARHSVKHFADPETGEEPMPGTVSSVATSRFPEGPVAQASPTSSQRQTDDVQSISGDPDRSRAERISLLDPSAPAAVSARHLAQQVKRQVALRGVRSVVVTSALSGDGKTTTACNLAIALTRLDRSRSVVLVDLDLRRPSLAERLGVSPEIGVEEILEKHASVDDALVRTDVPGLSVLVVRQHAHDPEHLLASENLSGLIRTLEERFSIIIIDTPPVLSVADAASVLDVADGCLLVVRSGRSPVGSVRRAIEHLPAEKLIGSCVNFARGGDQEEHYDAYPAYSARSGEEAESGDASGGRV